MTKFDRELNPDEELAAKFGIVDAFRSTQRNNPDLAERGLVEVQDMLVTARVAPGGLRAISAKLIALEIDNADIGEVMGMVEHTVARAAYLGYVDGSTIAMAGQDDEPKNGPTHLEVVHD